MHRAWIIRQHGDVIQAKSQVTWGGTTWTDLNSKGPWWTLNSEHSKHFIGDSLSTTYFLDISCMTPSFLSFVINYTWTQSNAFVWQVYFLVHCGRNTHNVHCVRAAADIRITTTENSKVMSSVFSLGFGEMFKPRWLHSSI